MSKVYRVYFNRLNEAPQVWSVDEGTQATEINVVAVKFQGCDVETRADLDQPVGPDVPKVWVQARGVLHIEAGVAVITGSEIPKE